MIVTVEEMDHEYLDHFFTKQLARLHELMNANQRQLNAFGGAASVATHRSTRSVGSQPDGQSTDPSQPPKKDSEGAMLIREELMNELLLLRKERKLVSNYSMLVEGHRKLRQQQMADQASLSMQEAQFEAEAAGPRVSVIHDVLRAVKEGSARLCLAI